MMAFLSETVDAELAEGSPDLLRELLTKFIDNVDVGRGRRGLRGRLSLQPFTPGLRGVTVRAYA